MVQKVGCKEVLLSSMNVRRIPDSITDISCKMQAILNIPQPNPLTPLRRFRVVSYFKFFNFADVRKEREIERERERRK